MWHAGRAFFSGTVAVLTGSLSRRRGGATLLGAALTLSLALTVATALGVPAPAIRTISMPAPLPAADIALQLAAIAQAGPARHRLSRLWDGQVLSLDGPTASASASAAPAPEPRVLNWETRAGVVDDNFFASMHRAGVPPGIVLRTVNLFVGVLDFRRDVRAGDRFRLVYERLTGAAAGAGFGRILAVELITSGAPHQALWYQPDGAPGAYYTFDGRSLRRRFLRSPAHYTRISSGFGVRLHPILGYRAAHTGVDFAAPTGTPVVAGGAGIVQAAGRRGGYGNLVVLRHRDGYSTYYGHLSAFRAGLRRGSRVAQGDVIGYVGSTGRATGPHVHYELRLHGRPLNPLTASVTATPLGGRQLQAFRRHAEVLLAALEPAGPTLALRAN